MNWNWGRHIAYNPIYQRNQRKWRRKQNLAGFVFSNNKDNHNNALAWFMCLNLRLANEIKHRWLSIVMLETGYGKKSEQCCGAGRKWKGKPWRSDWRERTQKSTREQCAAPHASAKYDVGRWYCSTIEKQIKCFDKSKAQVPCARYVHLHQIYGRHLNFLLFFFMTLRYAHNSTQPRHLYFYSISNQSQT